MSCTCVTATFGEAPFGEGAFGGPIGSEPGAALPYNTPFDLFCFGCCGTFVTIFNHAEITSSFAVGQIVPDAPTETLLFRSGTALYNTGTAWLGVDVGIPQAWTAEFEVTFQGLPENFNNIQTNHIYFGVMDAQGASAGILISKAGVLYTGAVHHAGGVIVLDHPTQALPDSSALVEENVKYVIRIATSFDNGATYIYWTRADEVETIGHQLRYLMPALSSSSASQVPTDNVLVSTRGSAADGSLFFLSKMCVAESLIIANIIPVADAGVDQAVRTCAIVQLDGTASFDPEGAELTYKWRLLDTPLGSQYIFDGVDGLTYPEVPPTGFTDKFYSVDLAALDSEDAIDPGDVLIVDGDPYDVVSTGLDGNGFYVELASEIVDSHATFAAFKLLRQRGISGITTAKPTFLPDKPGLYKFDLIVHDGNLFSDPAIAVINVTESPVPRGLIPDLRFLWGYLSDFWGLIEEKERVEVFWSGLAQIAASELLNLWQLDYSKSLRDVQRTFQRRWLRYDMQMEEDPIRIERTEVHALFGGLLSSGLSASASGVLDLEVNDTTLSINVPAYNGVDLDLFVAQLQTQLDLVVPGMTVTTIIAQDTSIKRLRLNAPFTFKVASSSTYTAFPFSTNTYPKGTGTLVNSRAFRVDVSLAGIDIKEGDFFVLGDTAYRIARVSTDATDLYQFQRITTLDEMPTDAGNNWSIGGKVVSDTLDFWHGCVCENDHVFLDVVELETGNIITVQTKALGANFVKTSELAIDTGPVGSYLLDDAYAVYFRSVIRRHYLPIDRLVQDVPYLQEKIKNSDDTQVLRRNVDFFIEAFRNVKVFRFIVGTPDVWQGEVPPLRLWAETTYLDNRPLIEANFGIPAGFSLDDLTQVPSNVDYLSAVRGLWFAYFNGPTLFNLRAGVQILLGLPFAEEGGFIEEIRDDFSSKTARLLVRDTKNTEIVRSYTYPAVLELEVNPSTGQAYKVGDLVNQFAPLVKGSEVVDWVKDPKWIEGYINQGSSFEVEKFFKFLIRVNADVFNLSALLFAQSFVKRIKPTYTHPIFIVQRTIDETEISVSDVVNYKGYLELHAGPLFGNNHGQAQMWDQPRPGGGGWWGHADESDPNAPPTFPTPTVPTDWGGDEYLLAPAQVPTAKLTTTAYAGGAGLPTADSIFYAGMPVFTEWFLVNDSGLRWLTPTETKIGLTTDSTVTGTIDKIALYYRGVGDGSTLNLVVKNNGVTVATLPFVVPNEGGNPDANLHMFNFSVSLGSVAGDDFEVFVTRPSGEFNTYVESIGVVLGVGIDWLSDTNLPQGTYHTVFPL
jgi:hypothetical protein